VSGDKKLKKTLVGVFGSYRDNEEVGSEAQFS